MLDAPVVAVLLVAALIVGRFWGERRGRRREAFRVVARTRDLRREANSAKEAHERARADASSVREAVDDGLLILGPMREVLEANPAAKRFFEIDVAQRPTLMAAIRSSELAEVVADLDRGHADSRPVRIGDRLFAARAVPLLDDRALLILRDLTLLERLERARRDLVANVSHDLRTPLTSARLLLENLEHGTMKLTASDQDPFDLQRTFDGLATQLGTISALAEGLVEINRLESGRALFRLETIALSDIVEDAVSSTDARTRADSLSVRVTLADDAQVLADRRHIVRVLVNLIDNACHHSPSGGTIEIGAQRSKQPGEMQLWVADDGPGVTPVERERIFERFYRSDRARSSTGSGLGLAIAKHIVEGHGGRIWVDDFPLGGARFCFTVLLAEEWATAR